VTVQSKISINLRPFVGQHDSLFLKLERASPRSWSSLILYPHRARYQRRVSSTFNWQEHPRVCPFICQCGWCAITVRVPRAGPGPRTTQPNPLQPLNSPTPEQAFLAKNYDENARREDCDPCGISALPQTRLRRPLVGRRPSCCRRSSVCWWRWSATAFRPCSFMC